MTTHMTLLFVNKQTQVDDVSIQHLAQKLVNETNK